MDRAGLVEMIDVAQAAWIVNNLNGNTPAGLSSPIKVVFSQSQRGKGAYRQSPYEQQQPGNFLAGLEIKLATHTNDGGNKIWVGQIPLGTSKDVLWHEFTKFGPVQDVYIRDDGKVYGRMWGFITFMDSSGASEALSAFQTGAVNSGPQVVDVFLKDDGQRTGRLWGFVTMGDPSQAQTALSEVNGKMLQVAAPAAEAQPAAQGGDMPMNQMNGAWDGGSGCGGTNWGYEEPPAMAGVAPPESSALAGVAPATVMQPMAPEMTAIPQMAPEMTAVPQMDQGMAPGPSASDQAPQMEPTPEATPVPAAASETPAMPDQMTMPSSDTAAPPPQPEPAVEQVAPVVDPAPAGQEAPSAAPATG